MFWSQRSASCLWGCLIVIEVQEQDQFNHLCYLLHEVWKTKEIWFYNGITEELLHWSHHCLHVPLLHYPFKQINRMLGREFMCRRLGNSQSFLYGWRRSVQGLCFVCDIWSPELKGSISVTDGWLAQELLYGSGENIHGIRCYLVWVKASELQRANLEPPHLFKEIE